METVVIVAIGVLATIFLASFAALVVVCRQRYCRPRDLLQRYDSKPIVDLIGAMETQSEPSELELDDVVITNPHIEAILENEDWIEDASDVSLLSGGEEQRWWLQEDLSHSDRKTCCHDDGLWGQDEDFCQCQRHHRGGQAYQPQSGRCCEVHVPSAGPETPGCTDNCPAPVCQSSGAGDQECLPPDWGPGLD
uniref:Transmembrane protein 98 n=1 Tax=Equus caballus TaxID=9796 RepID=A0A5F5PLQ0_HORSE